MRLNNELVVTGYDCGKPPSPYRCYVVSHELVDLHADKSLIAEIDATLDKIRGDYILALYCQKHKNKYGKYFLEGHDLRRDRDYEDPNIDKVENDYNEWVQRGKQLKPLTEAEQLEREKEDIRYLTMTIDLPRDWGL